MIKAVQLLIVALALILSPYSQAAYSTRRDTDDEMDTVEEEIWTLEEEYFTNLYKADYEAVLAITHNQFLGWPGSLPQPVNKEGSARFMKQLIPRPTLCTFTIERGGIRVLEGVVLTQYIIHVNCSGISTVAKTQSSRIIHTWVKEGDRWKLLGGMSYDQ